MVPSVGAWLLAGRSLRSGASPAPAARRVLVATPGAAGAAVLAGTQVVRGRARRQRVAHARRVAAGRVGLRGDDRGDRGERAAAPRLRLGALGRRADRHPLQRGARTPSGKVHVSFLYASQSDRVGYPIPPHPRIEGGAGLDRRPPRAASSTGPPASTTSSTTRGPIAHSVNWTAGSGAVFDLRSERAATRGLDVGGRRGARDPAGARAARGGRERASSTTRSA